MASCPRALSSVGLTSQMAHPARIASRAYSTAVRSHVLRLPQRPAVSMKLAASGRIAFRRAYTDEAPKPTPGKLRKTLRWAWRFTYLSAAGLVGYTFITIYQDRHPEPQSEPDPSKKTLVILGESHWPSSCSRTADNLVANFGGKQELVGAPSLYSRSWIPKTTMSLLCHPEITSCSLLYCPRVPLEPSNTGPSWSQFELSFDTKKPLSNSTRRRPLLLIPSER